MVVERKGKRRDWGYLRVQQFGDEFFESWRRELEAETGTRRWAYKMKMNGREQWGVVGYHLTTDRHYTPFGVSPGYAVP
jgi:8-oxo-dGTP pyrophosphatase MutT (NUDIX family)